MMSHLRSARGAVYVEPENVAPDFASLFSESLLGGTGQDQSAGQNGRSGHVTVVWGRSQQQVVGIRRQSFRKSLATVFSTSSPRPPERLASPNHRSNPSCHWIVSGAVQRSALAQLLRAHPNRSARTSHKIVI
jgi:hypothetical protein